MDAGCHFNEIVIVRECRNLKGKTKAHCWFQAAEGHQSCRPRLGKQSWKRPKLVTKETEEGREQEREIDREKTSTKSIERRAAPGKSATA